MDIQQTYNNLISARQKAEAAAQKARENNTLMYESESDYQNNPVAGYATLAEYKRYNRQLRKERDAVEAAKQQAANEFMEALQSLPQGDERKAWARKAI